MARPNYSGEKRRKELEKQRKKAEKRRRKLEHASGPPKDPQVEESVPPSVTAVSDGTAGPLG
jgi:hypothetical protein